MTNGHFRHRIIDLTYFTPVICRVKIGKPCLQRRGLWTYAFEPDSGTGFVNDEVRDNRRLLYNVMTAAGFTNLPSEWWHFDYGDGMWAQLKNENAIYAGRLDAEVRDQVPYKNMEKVREADHKQQAYISKMADIILACEEIGSQVTAEKK